MPHSAPQAARRLKPSLMARFMIFTRQQQATQKAAGSTTNDGASMDLLGWAPAVPRVSCVVLHPAIPKDPHLGHLSLHLLSKRS